jgi:signal transduction histidine kinase
MMGERAEAVGAQLTVTSRPGHGTELILHWAKDPQQETL